MLVAARAGQVLADLRIAVGHKDTSDPQESVPPKAEKSSQRAASANPSKLRTEAPCTVSSLTLTTPHRSIRALSSISFFPSNSESYPKIAKEPSQLPHRASRLAAASSLPTLVNVAMPMY